MTATAESNGWPAQPAGRIALLDVDPDLAGSKSGAELGSIRDRLTAPVYRLRAGALPEPPMRRREGHIGFLVLKGVLLYEVSACGRATAELLGPGDLVRPWRRDSTGTLESEANWTVLEQALLADLGCASSAHWNDDGTVAEALIGRCIERAEAAALQRSITAHVRVDVRLLAYLWHLADRFGVVIPGGVKLDIPLTHAVLARLVGARRPTVTTALQRLMHLGYLRRDGRAYLLLGDATEAVAELDSRSPSHDFAQASADGDGAVPVAV